MYTVQYTLCNRVLAWMISPYDILLQTIDCSELLWNFAIRWCRKIGNGHCDSLFSCL